MKKIGLYVLLCFLCVLALCACAPEAQTQQVTVELSDIDRLPEGMEGSLNCTVIYMPGRELSAEVRNDTEFTLVSGYRTGDLCRQEENGVWVRMECGEELIYTAEGVPISPGAASEDKVFSAGGFYEPELEEGTYKLVFGVTLRGAGEEQKWSFDLELPFSVPSAE